MTFRINDYDGHRRVALGDFGRSVAGQRSLVESISAARAEVIKAWIRPNLPPTDVTVSTPAYQDFGVSRQISVTASDPENDPLTVDYYVDDMFIGSRASAPYDMPWSGAVGSHVITVKVKDDHDNELTSNPLTVHTGDKTGSLSADNLIVTTGGPIHLSHPGLSVPGTTSIGTARYYANGQQVHSYYGPVTTVTTWYPDTPGSYAMTSEIEWADGSIAHFTGPTIVVSNLTTVHVQWLVVEVTNQLAGNDTEICELTFYGADGTTVVPYTTSPTAAYDPITGGVPTYWNLGTYDRSNLNDGGLTVTGTQSTSMLYPSTALSGQKARFVVDFGSAVDIAKVAVVGGQYDSNGTYKPAQVDIRLPDSRLPDGDPSSMVASGQVGVWQTIASMTWSATTVRLQTSFMTAAQSLMLAYTQMTSDSAPAPQVASASSVYNPSQAAYKAFNNAPDSYAWASGTTAWNQWVQIDLGSVKSIAAYNMRNRDYPYVGSPKTWNLLYSNDGTNWSTAHAVVNDTNDAQGAWKFAESHLFDTPIAARYWRVLVVEPFPSDSGYTEIDELALFMWA